MACCILLEGGYAAIGACGALVDDVAFDCSVQRVFDSEGITGDAEGVSEVVD